MSEPRETTSTFASLVAEFTSFYSERIGIVRRRRPGSEDIHRSKEELTQAAFVRCWERVAGATASSEEIHHIRSLFWKSALRTERKSAERALKKQWLLLQKDRILAGSGSFRAPESSQECDIGVGQRVDQWQEQPAENETALHELVDQLRSVRDGLSRREELAIGAIASGLSGREGAEAIGVSETAFRQILFRLRRKLRDAVSR